MSLSPTSNYERYPWQAVATRRMLEHYAELAPRVQARALREIEKLLDNPKSGSSRAYHDYKNIFIQTVDLRYYLIWAFTETRKILFLDIGPKNFFTNNWHAETQIGNALNQPDRWVPFPFADYQQPVRFLEDPSTGILWLAAVRKLQTQMTREASQTSFNESSLELQDALNLNNIAPLLVKNAFDALSYYQLELSKLDLLLQSPVRLANYIQTYALKERKGDFYFPDNIIKTFENLVSHSGPLLFYGFNEPTFFLHLLGRHDFAGDFAYNLQVYTSDYTSAEKVRLALAVLMPSISKVHSLVSAMKIPDDTSDYPKSDSAIEMFIPLQQKYKTILVNGEGDIRKLQYASHTLLKNLLAENGRAVFSLPAFALSDAAWEKFRLQLNSQYQIEGIADLSAFGPLSSTTTALTAVITLRLALQANTRQSVLFIPRDMQPARDNLENHLTAWLLGLAGKTDKTTEQFCFSRLNSEIGNRWDPKYLCPDRQTLQDQLLSRSGSTWLRDAVSLIRRGLRTTSLQPYPTVIVSMNATLAYSIAEQIKINASAVIEVTRNEVEHAIRAAVYVNAAYFGDLSEAEAEVFDAIETPAAYPGRVIDLRDAKTVPSLVIEYLHPDLKQRTDLKSYLLIRPQDIREKTLQGPGQTVCVSESLPEIATLQEGDILVSDVGTFRACIVPSEWTGAVFSENLVLLRANPSLISSDNLLQQLWSAEFRLQLKFIAPSEGVTRFYLADLEELFVQTELHPEQAEISPTELKQWDMGEPEQAVQLDLPDTFPQLIAGKLTSLSIPISFRQPECIYNVEIIPSLQPGELVERTEWRWLQWTAGDEFMLSLVIRSDEPGPITLTCQFRFQLPDGSLSRYVKDIFFEVIPDHPAIWEPIEQNPYITGKPVETPEMFVGREDVLDFLKSNLIGKHQTNVILLQGNRRTGKSSILKQCIQQRLFDHHLPVYIDCQGLGKLSDHLLFVKFAREIVRALRQARQPESVLKLAQSPIDETDSFYSFRTMLEGLTETLNVQSDKIIRLILMLDEFEVIDQAIQHKQLSPEILENLRHLFQHHPQLAIILTGSYRLRKLSQEYWSALFGLGIKRDIGFLSEEAARSLITEPLENEVTYADEAVQRILDLTACHPYFVQMLCHNIVTLLNEQKTRYVTRSLVEDAAEETLESADGHLSFMFTASGPFLYQALLVYLASLLGEESTSQAADAPASELELFAAAYQLPIAGKEIEGLMRDLADRDIISIRGSVGAAPVLFQD